MAARHWDRRVVDPVKRRWPVEDAPANRYSPAQAGQLAAFLPGYSIDLESSYIAMSPTERRDFAADLMRETTVISGLAVADTAQGWEKAAHLGGAAIELPWLHGPGRGVGIAARSFRNVRNATDPGWHTSVVPGAFDKYRNLGPVGGSGTVWYADTPVIQAETILRRAQDQLDYLRAKRRWEKQWEALMGSSPRQSWSFSPTGLLIPDRSLSQVVVSPSMTDVTVSPVHVGRDSDAAPKVKTIPTAQPSVDFDQAAAAYLAESPETAISTPRVFLADETSKTKTTGELSVNLFDEAAAEYLAGESPEERISTPRMFLPGPRPLARSSISPTR